MNKSEFEKDLELDPNQLDVMAAMQAETFFKWAERAVVAREESERKKFALEVTQAKLSNNARMDPEKFKLSKVTEGSINDAVKNHATYLEAMEDYLQARAESSILDKAVEAMEQKKRMIESLITLHGQQYFAGPSVPRNLGEAWKEAKEKRSEAVLDKMKKRVRVRKGGE